MAQSWKYACCFEYAHSVLVMGATAAVSRLVPRARPPRAVELIENRSALPSPSPPPLSEKRAASTAPVLCGRRAGALAGRRRGLAAAAAISARVGGAGAHALTAGGGRAGRGGRGALTGLTRGVGTQRGRTP